MSETECASSAVGSATAVAAIADDEAGYRTKKRLVMVKPFRFAQSFSVLVCGVVLGCSSTDVPVEDGAEVTETTSSSATVPPLPRNEGTLRNRGTGLCLDSFNGGGNAYPYFAPCTSSNVYQQWFYFRAGNRFFLNEKTGCLDGYNPPGAQNPYMARCDSADGYQKWFYEDRKIRNSASNLCLDGFNGGGNNRPYFAPCDDANPYQRWD